MWMQYYAQNWVEEYNIDSAVEKVAEELYALSWDSLHAANYDIEYCFDDDEVQNLMNDHKKFSYGGNLCNKYCHGVVDLEEFCEQMVRLNLKRFLYPIEKYLPQHIIEKYEFHQSDNEGDEDFEKEEAVGEDVCGSN